MFKMWVNPKDPSDTRAYLNDNSISFRIVCFVAPNQFSKNGWEFHSFVKKGDLLGWKKSQAGLNRYNNALDECSKVSSQLPVYLAKMGLTIDCSWEQLVYAINNPSSWVEIPVPPKQVFISPEIIEEAIKINMTWDAYQENLKEGYVREMEILRKYFKKHLEILGLE